MLPAATKEEKTIRTYEMKRAKAMLKMAKKNPQKLSQWYLRA